VPAVLTRETMQGLYVLTITPFAADGGLDEQALRGNLNTLVALGVDGIITSGTNGEFHTTTDEERARIVGILVEETRGKAVAVAGCSGVNTAESIARMRVARDAGADAVMNVLPFYHILSKSEAYQYFEDLYAGVPDVGLIIYNNPVTTQVLLNDDDLVRIQQIPTVCGTKMIGADMSMYLNCLRRTSIRHFPLEPLWGVSNAVGGNGVMASFIYAFPGYMMRWWQTIRSGDLNGALAMQHEVNRLLQELVLPLIRQEGFNEIAATKAVVDAAGFLKAGAPRKPFRPVPKERIDQFRAAIGRDFPQFFEGNRVGQASALRRATSPPL
jgi:4-hydroxy-tetrahydrodipicolinate synthase